MKAITAVFSKTLEKKRNGSTDIKTKPKEAGALNTGNSPSLAFTKETEVFILS